MKIQKVNIKEFKCLKDLDVDLNGSNVILIGDNGVGKSSFIQFIEIALGKEKSVPPDALGSGYVIADKEGNQYSFFVNIKNGKAKVTIEGKDGLKDNRKSTLSSIIGSINFDIDEFVKLSESNSGKKKQVEIFKSFLPAETKDAILKYEANIGIHYEERTDIGRRRAELEGSIKINPLNVLQDEELRKYKEVDTKALTEELTKINAANNKIIDFIIRKEQKQKDNIKDMESLNELKKQRELLNSKIESFESLIIQDSEKLKEADLYINKNPKKDTREIQNKLATAGDTNKQFNNAKQLLSQRELLVKLTDEYESETVLIETQRQAIQDAVKDIGTPIEGLTFTSDELIYNGISVDIKSLSTSEIMELGIKLKMVENPGAPLLIQRAESIGKKRFEEILAIAKKNDLQIIMEQVERGVEKLQIEIFAL